MTASGLVAQLSRVCMMESMVLVVGADCCMAMVPGRYSYQSAFNCAAVEEKNADDFLDKRLVSVGWLSRGVCNWCKLFFGAIVWS
jgi:hypothetical protein